jgi:tetratricopeptide (TPR) repeat protein
MHPRPLLVAILALALPLTPAHADTRCNDACMTLVREGAALQAQAKYQEALGKLKEAASAAPQASLPVASIASLLEQVSKRVKPEQAEQYRKQAESAARAALRLDPEDPVAQEALRVLASDGQPVLHQASAAAARVIAEAEVEFAQQHFAQALTKYEEAMRLDPQLSNAWVGAGDCYFMQKDWAQAEAHFRRATEIEPRNSQAWRFLSDALIVQKKNADGEAALFSAIVADPSQGPNWTKLGQLRAHAGLPLKRLQLDRGSRVTIGTDGKPVISLDSDAIREPKTPDAAIRLALAVVESNARAANAEKKLTPFEIELQAWQTAMKVADELKANKGDSLTDPALLQMQAFYRDGQLEPAILLLLYKEGYRPALEKWLAANPQGINGFVTRYGLKP